MRRTTMWCVAELKHEEYVCGELMDGGEREAFFFSTVTLQMFLAASHVSLSLSLFFPTYLFIYLFH